MVGASDIEGGTKVTFVLVNEKIFVWGLSLKLFTSNLVEQWAASISRPRTDAIVLWMVILSRSLCFFLFHFNPYFDSSIYIQTLGYLQCRLLLGVASAPIEDQRP